MTRPWIVPGDIYAAKEIGIDRWRAHFFSPIPDQVFNELFDSCLQRYDRAHADLSHGMERDLLLSDFSFYLLYLHHAHARAIRQAAGKAGAKYRKGPLVEKFLDPDFQNAAAAFRPDRLTAGVHRFQLRRMAKRFHFNPAGSALTRIFSLGKPSKIWSLGSWSRLKSDYVRKQGVICDHPYVSTVLHQRKLFPVDVPSRLMAAVRDLIEDTANLFKERFGCETIVEEAWASWLERLKDLNRVYSASTTEPFPEAVLLSEVAQPVHKALCLGFRNTGSKIVGFHHGNDMGNVRETVSAYTEFAHCDEFACPTEAAAEFHREEYCTAGISNIRPVAFTSVDTHYYEQLLDEASKIHAPRQVHRVMLMGYPMNARRYAGNPADWFYYQLDLELSLIEDLNKHELEVIYKMHPERQEEAAGIFEEKCSKVLKEPFESVWGQADAYLFGCTSSTTFGYALCLNRPVIVLDLPERPWNLDTYALLAARCEMVPAWFGAGDRVEYDKEALIRCLRQPKLSPDMRYVKAFMCPPQAPERKSA